MIRDSNTDFTKPIAVVFRFHSKLNSGNVRLYSLLNSSKITKVVEVKGLKVPATDRLLLSLIPFYRKLRLKTDLRKYQWIHIMSPKEGLEVNKNQILHLDDPSFDDTERIELESWAKTQAAREKKSLIICTSEKVKLYCLSINEEVPVEVIPQGFTISNKPIDKYPRFACVYSSPYIFFKGDKYADHPTWGSTHFLEELAPRILDIHEGIDIHLVGRLGYHAFQRVKDQKRIVIHSLVSPQENANILSKCHIGLYPRLHDHGRRVLKISEYMGAGLPIVAYSSEDTTLVSDLNLGIRVGNIEEFVSAVRQLYFETKLRKDYETSIATVRIGYDWESLARIMDEAIIKMHSD